MRRREVLTAAGGLVGTTALASVSGGRAASGEPYAPLGRVEIPGAAEAVVDDDGTTAYVATLDGFAAVDVSDPASPTVLARRTDLLADREDGPMRNVKDVNVDGDRLLVVGPASSDSTVFNGAALFDVSDPADPQLVASHSVPNSIHNGFLDGEVAYLTAGGGGQKLAVVDLSAEDTARMATWDPTDHDDAWAGVGVGHRVVHDVSVHDGRAYLACWDAGTFVLDVSDPAAPTYVTMVSDYTREEAADLGRIDRFIPPGNHHYAQVSDDGSLLAVGREAWAVRARGRPGGITLYDVSTPAAPAELATIAPVRARDESIRSGVWTTAHNFDLVGDRLYSSWYQAGVKIHDVSDPANPELLAWWRDPETAAFWTAQHAGSFFVGSTHDVAAGDPFSGLYTFPDRPGEQADPPTIPSPTPTPTERSPTDATPTSTDSPTPTPTETPTATPTPSPTATPTPDAAAGDGFGALAALAALGGAAAWWRRRE